MCDFPQFKTSFKHFKEDHYEVLIWYSVFFGFLQFSFKVISSHLPQTEPTNLNIPLSSESPSKPAVITGLEDILKVLWMDLEAVIAF